MKLKREGKMPTSSKEMIKLYRKSGWELDKGGGKGSHTKMVKEGRQPVIIPHRKELRKGTEQALLKQLKDSR